MTLEDKITHSTKILLFAQKFAEKQGYKLILAYSGGKDSEVLLDLANSAGIKFEAIFNNTTVELSETCKFIRKNKTVIWQNPKKNFYEICRHKKGLPSIFRRFCCSGLKERKRAKTVTLLGIRKDESEKRTKYWNEFSDKKKKQLPYYTFQKLFEEKCKSKSVYFNPVFEWTEKDIWKYIRQKNLQINPVYKHQNRCGCWLCPFASFNQKMEVIRKNPSILKPLIKTAQYLIDIQAPITKRIPDLCGIIEWFLIQDTISEFVENRKNLLFNEKSEIEKIIENII